MRIRSIGICDKDMDYAISLMDGINHYGRDEFRACAFSNVEQLYAYLEKDELDMVLSNREIDGVRCIFLSENPDTKKKGVSESNAIFKYQSILVILKEIRILFKPAELSVRNRCRSIAVYSPLGRCGKTGLAKALAAMDEVRGGLYVSFENFLGEKNGPDTDLLYLLKQGSTDLSTALTEAICQEPDFSALYASGAYIDTHDVLKDDIDRLSKELTGLGKFSTICYDIGSAAFVDMSIFGCFDLIYLPVLTDETSVIKLKRFRQLMTAVGMQEEFSRCIEIQVPDVDYRNAEMVQAIWQASR